MTKEAAMAKYYASEVAVKTALMLYRYLAAMDIQKIFRWKNFTVIVNSAPLEKALQKFKKL